MIIASCVLYNFRDLTFDEPSRLPVDLVINCDVNALCYLDRAFIADLAVQRMKMGLMTVFISSS